MSASEKTAVTLHDVMTVPDNIAPLLGKMLMPTKVYGDGAEDPGPDAFVDLITKAANTRFSNLATSMDDPVAREAVASLAYQVSQTKVWLDETIGGGLTEEVARWKRGIDTKRRTIRTKLEELRDRIRKPLTDWEAKAELRAQEVTKRIDTIRKLGIFAPNATVEDLEGRLVAVEGTQVAQADYDDKVSEATQAREAAMITLSRAITARKERDAQAKAAAEENARAQLRQQEEKAADAAAGGGAPPRQQADPGPATTGGYRPSGGIGAPPPRTVPAQPSSVQPGDNAQGAPAKPSVEQRRKVNASVLKAFVALGCPEQVAMTIIGQIATDRIDHVSIRY